MLRAPRRAVAAAVAVLVPGLMLATVAASARADANATAGAKLPAAATLRFLDGMLHARQLSQGKGVTVAIVSSGVDPRADGLAGRVTTGPDYMRPPRSSGVHSLGTLAATLIAGSGGSNAIEGVAPMAHILSVRASPDSREPGAQAFFASANVGLFDAEGIRYAASHGAQVIYVTTSISSGPSAISQLASAVNYATSRNAVVVGDEGSVPGLISQYTYPPGLPGVIGVAAVTMPGLGTRFDKDQSARNNSILIAAPGNSVIVADDWWIDGTGAAAAWVAGTAALIKSLYPHLSPAMVARALAMSATYRPSGGYDNTLGFGLLNAHDALLAASHLTKITATAQPGPSAAGYFGAGPVTGTIDAVHHSTTTLALYAAAIAAGVAMLISAFVLSRRRRQKRKRKVGGLAPVMSAED